MVIIYYYIYLIESFKLTTELSYPLRNKYLGLTHPLPHK